MISVRKGLKNMSADSIVVRINSSPLAENTGLTGRYLSESIVVRRVGNKLGARYLLEGSLRQAGNKLRITVQLVDTNSGAHLWAETFDRVWRVARRETGRLSPAGRARRLRDTPQVKAREVQAINVLNRAAPDPRRFHTAASGLERKRFLEAHATITSQHPNGSNQGLWPRNQNQTERPDI
jgi:hypothetical protein